jgi:hypothetical protein
MKSNRHALVTAEPRFVRKLVGEVRGHSVLGEKLRASAHGVDQGRRWRPGSDSSRDVSRNAVPGVGRDTRADAIVRKDQDSVLEQRNEDQHPGAVRGRKHPFFDERLGCAAFDSAIEGLGTDEPSRRAVEAADDPSRQQAELETDEKPQVVRCAPASEETYCNRRTNRPDRASDQCALPRDFGVRVASLDDVDDQLAGRGALRLGGGGRDGVAVGLREEGVDSAGHGLG